MSSNETKTIGYAKLRSGDWGLRGPVELLIEGQVVTVTKKSGEEKSEVVGRVIWHNEETAIAAIIAQRLYQPASRYARQRFAGVDSCGYPCPVTGRRCCPSDPCHDCL